MFGCLTNYSTYGGGFTPFIMILYFLLMILAIGVTVFVAVKLANNKPAGASTKSSKEE